MFLHGRAVECLFTYAEGATGIAAPCRVGKTDLGEWLLANGWAIPTDAASDAYRRASARARCTRLGIWRGERTPQSCPAATAAN